MRTRRAASFFEDFPPVLKQYRDYWGRLAAVTAPDAFRRWLFAFCSVHTSWPSTVRGYEAIRNFKPWMWTKDDLLRTIQASGAGLHNHRAEYIWKFARDYWRDPGRYRRWTSRDELAEEIVGLGPAKTSFALNMIDPIGSKVVCLDVHLLRLYGIPQERCNHRIYRRVEQDWLARCAARPPSPTPFTGTECRATLTPPTGRTFYENRIEGQDGQGHLRRRHGGVLRRLRRGREFYLLHGR